MKDSLQKPPSSISVQKATIKKEATVTVRVLKAKRVAKVPVKKINIKKEKGIKTEKKKRGRPKISEKPLNKSIPKPSKNAEESSKSTRKRKSQPLLPNVIKVEDCLSVPPPPKKPKTNESSLSGAAKSSAYQKVLIPKLDSAIEQENAVSSSSNEVLSSKKLATFGVKKGNTSTSLSSKNSTSVPKKKLLNGSGWTLKQPYKVQSPPSDNVSTTTTTDQTIPRLLTPKEVKKEKLDDVDNTCHFSMMRHRQRMASLDAMAKMHVICTTDRKIPSEHRPKVQVAAVNLCPEAKFDTPNSLIPCEHVPVEVKKETYDSEMDVVQKQIKEMCVKDKQLVMVSSSKEPTSVVQSKEQTKPSDSTVHPKEKKLAVKKKIPSKLLSKPSSTTMNIRKKAKLKSHSKVVPGLLKKPKLDKVSKEHKKVDKKISKAQNKIVAFKAVNLKTASLSKPPKKPNTKKPVKKKEKSKTDVKMKETNRIQKTGPFESVTTIDSDDSTSSAGPVNHLMTKTKKPLVTDEENMLSKKAETTSTTEASRDSYCMTTTDSQCSIGHHSECCNYLAHASTKIIPIAHVQSCSLGHGLSMSAEASATTSSRCECSFPMHRFGHQQQIIYSPSHHTDCGCCCSVQTVPESCLLRKGLMAYGSRLASHSFATESICSDCAASGAAGWPQPPPPPPPSSTCTCCELHRDPAQHHRQSTGSCLQYLSSPPQGATTTSLLPCEQSPLDLSLTSAAASGGEAELALRPNAICCRDHLFFLRRTSAPHAYHQSFGVSNTCCRCNNQICESQNVESLQCSNRSIIPIVQSHPPVVAPSAVSSAENTPSSSSIVRNSNVAFGESVPLETAKRETSLSPCIIVTKLSPGKKRKFAHGWSWYGTPVHKLIALTNDSIPCPRKCYPAVRHKEGDLIQERDCVLLKSGPKDTDLPYVAKVAAFWENPEDGEMMLSLLWYYRPEHTEQGRGPSQAEDEVFASRHRDANSVACIEDRCYVLTFTEYCRYRARLAKGAPQPPSPSVVSPPAMPGGYPRLPRLPPGSVAPDMVLFCRSVYDFRQKRLLKNPS